MPKSLNVIITGRVQGVGYRQWTAGQAKALGLIGWVRNRHDGTVEAVISGADDHIDIMLDRFKHGPSYARVENVYHINCDPPAEHAFIRLPDA